MIGVAGVGVAGSFSVAAAGVAPVVAVAFFWVRWNQRQHFYKIYFAIKITLALASFFPLGLALLACDGVGGAAFCCGDGGCVRPFAAAPAAGADGGGIARCCGVPIA